MVLLRSSFFSRVMATIALLVPGAALLTVLSAPNASQYLCKHPLVLPTHLIGLSLLNNSRGVESANVIRRLYRNDRGQIIGVVVRQDPIDHVHGIDICAKLMSAKEPEVIGFASGKFGAGSFQASIVRHDYLGRPLLSLYWRQLESLSACDSASWDKLLRMNKVIALEHPVGREAFISIRASARKNQDLAELIMVAQQEFIALSQ